MQLPFERLRHAGTKKRKRSPLQHLLRLVRRHPADVLHHHHLFADIKGEGVTPIRRLYGDGFLVDETMWHGYVNDGRAFLCDGRKGKVSFRLLHVFELADGRIQREAVWCDLAAIQRQLGATPA